LDKTYIHHVQFFEPAENAAEALYKAEQPLDLRAKADVVPARRLTFSGVFG